MQVRGMCFEQFRGIRLKSEFDRGRRNVELLEVRAFSGNGTHVTFLRSFQRSISFPFPGLTGPGSSKFVRSFALPAVYLAGYN